MIARAGFALVFALLLTLALMMLALGVLAVGTREATVAAAMVRKARAEREAERAAIRVVRAWSTESVRDLAVGEARRSPPDSTATGATIVRLDSTLYLVRGEGSVPGPDGAVVAAAGMMVRTLGSPAAVLPAAVTATNAVTVVGGRIEGAGPDTAGLPGTDGAACDTDPAPGVLAPAVTVGAGAVVTGTPPVERALPRAPPAPDPFAASLASRLADIRLTGMTVSPRPMAAGKACIADRRNWGSPDPAHPCHRSLPLVFAAGDLTVSGGTGRMAIVVNGDLRITDGAVLHGVIVVHGHLEISGASSIRGAVRARSVDVRDGVVARDGCAVGSAAAAPALDRAFRPPTRWWIPLF